MRPVKPSNAKLARGVLHFVYRAMKNQNKILLLVVVLATGLSAQEVPVGTKQASVGQVMGERDKGKEDEIAKLFETIRVDAKLPPLTRIRHRDSLEQLVCTIASAGTLGNRHSGDRAAYYKTARPQSISAELTRVASFKEQPIKNKLAYPRYSVAVWQIKGSQAGEPTFWVGVVLYWSALEEFVDYHFTDDVFYHNGWKKNIAPQCRGK
jgi:hypothetical protein